MATEMERPPPAVAVAIFAHNEQRRIAACLASLPIGRADIAFHLLVNGSTDRTAAIAREMIGDKAGFTIHELMPGGKSRTWNRFVYEILPSQVPEMVAFMDGDAEIAPGSFDALAKILRGQPEINAVAGMPLNGRSHQFYQQLIRDEGGVFGDLYALQGDFVRRLRNTGLKLPLDLVGDDGLIGAWAATDLRADDHWDRSRLSHAEGAGFLCEPIDLLSPRAWRMQYKRMISYAVRFFQGRIINHIMGKEGPHGLPERMSDLYQEWLPKLSPRSGAANMLFDRLALRRMASVMRHHSR